MTKLAHVTSVAVAGPGYPVDLHVGGHDLRADEPTDIGGTDTGPAPFGLLAASLAACTAITLRMYAERKSWPLERVQVRVEVTEDDGQQQAERVVRLDGALDEDQRSRLLEIAERTPVTKTLKRALTIRTRLGGA
jgi:putative redox protein